jgi:hypothetical protein
MLTVRAMRTEKTNVGSPEPSLCFKRFACIRSSLGADALFASRNLAGLSFFEYKGRQKNTRVDAGLGRPD